LAACWLASSSCASASASAFSTTLPAEVPNLDGWEKSVARTDLDHPRRIVEYELFVRPGREATYEVIRYRVRYPDAMARTDPAYTPNEKLQWDLNGRMLRRYELVPVADGSRWEELSPASERFARETGVILGLLSLHRKLLGLDDLRAR
jgi:hypothetical protein